MADTPSDNGPLLSVHGLKKWFPVKRGIFNRVVGQIKAVDGVSFELAQGDSLGLVGESGSGKTTVGRTILRALTPTGGRVLFHDPDRGHQVDLATLSRGELKPLRRHMQMIFQDPFASLNPRMTIFDIVGEPLLIHGVQNRQERRERVKGLMRQVGLDPRHLNRHPHAFSGGQRQRIGIARALALNPSFIVADEAVSALDVSVQAQVLNLLAELQSQLNLTYLFIAHDLSVVRYLCDRVAVMYVGQIVEIGPVRALFEQPMHPYTQALMSSVPLPDPRQRRQPIAMAGEVADPGDRPTGCAFHPRCHLTRQLAADAQTHETCEIAEAQSTARVMRRCADEAPELTASGDHRQSACHYSSQMIELSVEGAPAMTPTRT